MRRRAETGNNFSLKKGANDPQSKKRHLNQLALKGRCKAIRHRRFSHFPLWTFPLNFYVAFVQSTACTDEPATDWKWMSVLSRMLLDSSEMCRGLGGLRALCSDDMASRGHAAQNSLDAGLAWILVLGPCQLWLHSFFISFFVFYMSSLCFPNHAYIIKTRSKMKASVE